MAVAEIPRSAAIDLIGWGTRHPKFTINKFEHAWDHPVSWADESTQVGYDGNLVFKVNGIGEVRDYGGHTRLETRGKYNPLLVSQLWVTHVENVAPYMIHYVVCESLDRRRHFLSERTRASSGDDVYFTRSEQPNVEAFMTHLAIITSAGDFDWTEAEAKAAKYRESASPEA